MYGQFASFGEWAEINNSLEGHFLERMAPSAFEKTIAQNRKNIRVLFHHGHDPSIGYKVLGPIRELQTDTRYEVDLFDVDYVRGLLPGLEAGQYGASFRFSVLKDEIRTHPTRSDHNPKGLREVTVTELRLTEFGPTPFPAYKQATAGVRSSREIVRELHSSAYLLGPGERWKTRPKPGCSGVIERERVGTDVPASWETRARAGRAWWWLSTTSDWRL
jgi:phage head maturation protease